jgi:hypothetical protein
VNSILGAIGQAPITQLKDPLTGVIANDNPEIQFIYNLLRDATVDVQSEGWHFNRERHVPFSKDAVTNKIAVAADIIKLDLPDNWSRRHYNFVRRGGFLYDKITHTDIFTDMSDTIELDVVRVFPFDDSSTNNLFDVRYQLRLNDLYDFSSTSVMHYKMTMQHIDLLSQLLVGEVPIRHNQHQSRLYLDMDFTNDVSEGEFIIIECYRQLNPDTFASLYNDMYFKRYATALIKKQWGNNLLKFRGMQMLGGVEINGEVILNEAKEEIQKLEEEIKLAFDLPPMYQIG